MPESRFYLQEKEAEVQSRRMLEFPVWFELRITEHRKERCGIQDVCHIRVRAWADSKGKISFRIQLGNKEISEGSQRWPPAWVEGKAGTREGYCTLGLDGRVNEMARTQLSTRSTSSEKMESFVDMATSWQTLCLSVCEREHPAHDAAQLGAQVHQDPIGPRPQTKNGLTLLDKWDMAVFCLAFAE